MKRILTVSLVTFIVGGVIGYYLYSVNTRPDTITPRQHQTQSSHNNKTARQIVTDYAKNHYDHISSIDIDLLTDGNYQVKIYVDSGYQNMGYSTYTYTVGVNENAQEITSWELTSSD
jgi:hypothetical protein